MQIGDLALVVAATVPSNIGKVVELIRWCPPNEQFIVNPGYGLYRNLPSGVWLVKGDLQATNSLGDVYDVKTGCFPTARLMPLRGEPHQLPAKKEERPVCAM